MKFRLLSLSVLLVASLAACKKDNETASSKLGVDPTVPAPKDSIFTTGNSSWAWGGNAPMSYRVDGKLVNCNNEVTVVRLHRYDDGSMQTEIYGWDGKEFDKDILFTLNIPAGPLDMRLNQEYNIPTRHGDALLQSATKNPDYYVKYKMNTENGGNMRVKITAISATEIEGKFYGTLRQVPKMQTESGIEWSKIEEGYFKLPFADSIMFVP